MYCIHLKCEEVLAQRQDHILEDLNLKRLVCELEVSQLCL